MSVETPLTHPETWELIPWVINGTADAHAKARVEAHLRHCADCRDEYALQFQLHAGMQVPQAGAPDPQPALQRLLARIEAGSADTEPASAAPHTVVANGEPALTVTRGSRRWISGLAAAVAVQAVGLALLGTALVQRDDTPDTRAGFHTLSSAAVPSAALVRFVPAPGMTVSEMQSLLAEVKMHIVESSEESAIYGLAPRRDPAAPGAVATTDVAAVVTRLRAHPQVLLAEPIAGSQIR
ncbi:zf-HC2 domain-containing protein [Tahibacter amnicola]|uniref:Zf-HC2 domain-containing protein n=1 Tax=Tahibacter amnicola TaxID=2976241 RepID=A0ABY6BBM2_9GAMM|nr:zf-HC2 domain-containing protein [Tahibacter amnicola]UXI66515.1 zf-HC2 domain-containing protein [Tahibacter amnicola]